MKKVFLAFMAVATIAMVGCKKEESVTPTPSGGGEGGGEETELEIPDIAAPGAGKTTIAIYAEVCPKGAYLVGSFNSYNIADDAASFAAVQDAENWYAVTIDYAPDLAVKAIARPSDEDVPLAWDYQWGCNFDPDADTPKVPEGTVNTLVVKGGSNDDNFEFENSGEVKLINVEDNGVIYVQVKNWNKSPIIEAKKLETAWAKTSWDGTWSWKEMTAKGNGVFEVTGIWNGDGFNINSVGEDAGAAWYATDNANLTIQEGAKAGDEIKLTFTSEKGTVGKLNLEVIGAAADIPAGNGTFIITVTNRTYTAGDECIFTGNFEEKAWGDSDRAMTYNAGTNTWSWTGAYPKNFEFKVIYNGKWANDPNGKMTDPATYEYEFSIQD